MSAVAEARMMCCASCGLSELDDIKLQKCPDCDLVKYCSDDCQREHRTQHERACKKRAAELRDEILFRQPECSHLGDCPICFLPLPLDKEKSTLQSCCSKLICRGCFYANDLREEEENLQHKCPFCRQTVPKTQKENDRNYLKRAEKNDQVATFQMGGKHYNEGDYESAFEYWTKAVELGNVDAHYNISVMYREGQGVEKDEEKEMYHLEEAAIGGHPEARYCLGYYEGTNDRIDRAVNDRIDRAVKHWIIAANLGYDLSIQTLKKGYAVGHVSKEDFAAALRAHQAAVDATKSPQREAAAKAEATGEISFE